VAARRIATAVGDTTVEGDHQPSSSLVGLYALAQGWGASDERTCLEVRSGDERCCFCRKRASKVGPLECRGAMRICGHCLTMATREFERASESAI
jgi:hypothetical protein